MTWVFGLNGGAEGVVGYYNRAGDSGWRKIVLEDEEGDRGRDIKIYIKGGGRESFCYRPHFYLCLYCRP